MIRSTESEEKILLQIKGLRTELRVDKLSASVVDNLDLTIRRGEALGIVGESGCGKTMTALSILRLVPDPPARITGGSILFRERDLLKLPPAAIRSVRGSEISMIFQEPMTAMNPVFTVGDQIVEALLVHQECSRREARSRMVEGLARVGIASPERASLSYPHQLSGGMLQRAMIAMALICGPDLLIADEPTSALDVTVQAQILELIGQLRTEEEMAMLMITHDLGVVAEVCDRVAVMYAGEIVEEAATKELFESPLHPYTRGLFDSLPLSGRDRSRLKAIPGTVPSPFAYPASCRFSTRCPAVQAVCRQEKPELREAEEGRSVACFFPRQEDLQGGT